MKFNVLLTMALASSATFATEYNLEFDSTLNGVIDGNSYQFTKQISQIDNQWASVDGNEVLTGTTRFLNENLIKLEYATGTTTRFMMGSKQSNGSYIGTWYDESGSKGDFKLAKVETSQPSPLVCKDRTTTGPYQGAYCNGSLDGGGWQLAAVYKYGQGTPVDNLTNKDSSAHLKAAKWQSLLDKATELLIVAGDEYYYTWTSADITSLRSAENCHPLTDDLSKDVIFSNCIEGKVHIPLYGESYDSKTAIKSSGVTIVDTDTTWSNNMMKGTESGQFEVYLR